MTRGRKPKVKDEKVISFIIEMSDFSTSLQDLATFVEAGCGMVLTLPTITSYLKRELGDKGYDDVRTRWKLIRTAGHYT